MSHRNPCPVIADADGIAREVEGAGNVTYVRGMSSLVWRIPGAAEPLQQRTGRQP